MSNSLIPSLQLGHEEARLFDIAAKIKNSEGELKIFQIHFKMSPVKLKEVSF